MNEQLELDLGDRRNLEVTDDLLIRMQTMLQSIENFRVDIHNALCYTNGTHTFNDVVSGILQGRYVFWPLKESFVLWEIVEFPKKKFLHVFLAGGDLTELDGIVPKLKQAAILAGCSAVTLNGRRGWLRGLTDEGWKEASTYMICEV